MASYHSDEEQVEALKRWWRDNGRSVIAGAIIGVSALLGWRGWATYQDNQAADASIHYAALQNAMGRDDARAVEHNAQTLVEPYASTPYASLAALALAKFKAQAGDLRAAEAQLRWAIDHTSQQVVANLAKIRLARVLNAQGRHEEALAMLADEFPAAYTSLVEEVRGDALVAQNKTEAARLAYDRAILAARGDVEYLRMKRAELGQGAEPQS
ncbi:MAG: tetratricopeptide repeat protein [Pseudomonadota bacterium]|nr:tetratricopeptide repeat protein [Pseudomonadota bacterium]